MHVNPLNIPAVSIAMVKEALIAQFADPMLRWRASMLWAVPRVQANIAHPFGRKLVLI